MDINPDLAPELAVCSLADAFGIGVDLAELFGPAGDFCAVWLGTDAGTVRDFVVCTEDRGRDIDHLVRYAGLVAVTLDVDRAVLWRSDRDLTDGPRLADEFFAHRDELDEAGATLIDEIVVGADELRSLAITTFTDAPGWDDVSAQIDALGGS